MESREHEVAGERRLAREHGCLAVTDLADHGDVGILPEHAAQRGSKREARAGVDLDLREPVYLLLYRVLDGDDVLLGRVELVKGGVERRRLAGTGRAGDEYEAVRPGDEFLEARPVLGREAELVGAGQGRALPRDAHHDLFAEDAGQSRDAQIEVGCVGAKGEPSVLRHPLLGDVHVRDDLDARRDGLGHGDGQAGSVVQHAVDAVAYPDLVAFGLDVNVARTAGYAACDDGIDEPDDGLFLGARCELFDGQLFGLVAGDLDVVEGHVFRGVGDDVFGVRADAGHGVQAFGELVFGRDERDDLAAGDDVGLVDGPDVERVDDGEHHAVVFDADWQDAMFAQQVFGQHLDGLLVDLDVVEIDVGQSPLCAEALGLVFFGNVVKTDEDIAERVVVAGLAGLALDFQGVLEYVVAHGAALAQDCTDWPGIAPDQWRVLSHRRAPLASPVFVAGQGGR